MEVEAEAASLKKLEAEAEAESLHAEAEAEAEAEAVRNSPLPHHWSLVIPNFRITFVSIRSLCQI